MKDDSLVAEMVGYLLDGVAEGAEPDITAIYKRHAKVSGGDTAFQRLDQVLTFALEICPSLVGTPIMRPPNFLMVFAAISAAMVGIPRGKLQDRKSTRLNSSH